MPSDIQLIDLIKQKADSGAVIELVNRHTGVYFNTIKSYSVYPDFVKRVNVEDLKDDRVLNIYQWALTYDPNRGMKFGSYVGDMTRYMCKNIIHRNKESAPIESIELEKPDTTSEEQITREMALEEIQHEVAESENEKFRDIFALRHGQKPMSWRKIGQIVKMTHEGARKVYNKHIGAIKEHAVA